MALLNFRPPSKLPDTLRTTPRGKLPTCFRSKNHAITFKACPTEIGLHFPARGSAASISPVNGEYPDLVRTSSSSARVMATYIRPRSSFHCSGSRPYGRRSAQRMSTARHCSPLQECIVQSVIAPCGAPIFPFRRKQGQDFRACERLSKDGMAILRQGAVENGYLIRLDASAKPDADLFNGALAFPSSR